MKLKSLVASLLLLSFVTISAQDAREILDNAAAAYVKAGCIDATFTLSVKENNTNSIQKYNGTAKMNGNKFHINLSEVSTWFDGKTQWVYVKETNEVNITEPTGEELQGVSPSSLFSVYKKGYTLNYLGEKKINMTIADEIEMISQNQDSNFLKLIILINKSNKLFSQITATDKNGYTHTLTLQNLKVGVDSVDSDYTFNETEYPQAEIVDLR